MSERGWRFFNGYWLDTLIFFAWPIFVLLVLYLLD